METVRALLTQFGISNPNSATEYYVSYILLDLWGINKENRRKIRFRNLEVDGYHSFFGSFCDCIVSNDEGLRHKSNALYKLFNFGTKVYSIDEFIEKFDEAINNNKKPAKVYFDEVFSDYKTKQIIRVETMPENTLTYLNATNKYFGYFNSMIERVAKDETVIILYKSNDTSQPILAREIEILTNRMVRVFNEIGATFNLFNSQEEMPQIVADNWCKFLSLSKFDVCLTKFKDSSMMCLWIKLKQPIAPL